MGEHIAAVFGFPLIDIHTTTETTVAEIATQLATAAGMPPAIAPAVTHEAVARGAELGTVGLGHGEAILRARHPAISAPGGVVGRCVPPTNWCAGAAQPIHLVLLIYGPRPDAGTYLELLEQVVRLIIQIRNTPNCNGVVNPAAH